MRWLTIGMVISVLASMYGCWQLGGVTPPLQVPEARGEEACIRATTDYQRVYPPEGTVLNRRPAQWQTCTPWEP